MFYISAENKLWVNPVLGTGSNSPAPWKRSSRPPLRSSPRWLLLVVYADALASLESRLQTVIRSARTRL
jgi:hypothetical protein